MDFAGSDIMSKYQKVMGLPACQSDNAGEGQARALDVGNCEEGRRTL